MAQPRRTTGGATAEGLPTRALMDASFLMELAQQNITSTEQLQLGVFLKMKTSSIRDIMRESDDAVINSFNILEAWLDSRKSVGTSKALFDELSEACLKIKRADLVNFVRCKQLRQLSERLRKAKETAQSHKKNFNEQMQRVKLEHRETQEQLEDTKGEQQKITADLQKTSTDLHNTKADLQKTTTDLHNTKTDLQKTSTDLHSTKADLQKTSTDLHNTKTDLQKTTTDIHSTKADLQKTTADLQKTKAELQQTKNEVRRLNELLERQGSQVHTATTLQVNRTTRNAAANTPAPTEEMIASITIVAKPVRWENNKDKGLRAFRVMSMIRQHGVPELWRHVSQYCVGNGVLNLINMLTSDHLPDFLFLLSSCDVSQITSLQLDFNTVFEDVDAARQLAAAVANMPQLRELNLCGCHLTDRGFEAIAGGVTQQLTKLWFDSDNLTYAIEETVGNLLSRRPRLKIRLSLSSSSSLWFHRLKVDFPDRFF